MKLEIVQNIINNDKEFEFGIYLEDIFSNQLIEESPLNAPFGIYFL